MPQFVHLHNHTEYSLLDGAGKIDKLMDKACSCGMHAIGISDHGNLFGVPNFVLAARKRKLKPVIGSEFYLCDDLHDRNRNVPTAREQENENATKDLKTFHQILFAYSEEGYKNLCKLSSVSYTEGYYYKPRIDRNLLAKHCNGLIATTCCLASEVNNHIRNNRLDKAEEVFRWYLEHFGEHYYVELQRHGLADQDKCNAVLLQFAEKYNVKVIATNDVHYVDEVDADAHDLLLALQTGKDVSDPSRFRFTDDRGQLNRSFFFKTPDEMSALFHDLPQALENTVELAEKAQFELKLNGDLILPIYQVPPEFQNMDQYLAALTWERARQRYGELTTDLSERVDTELRIIAKMGYAGYFLIVQEFTTEARKRGVLVGPGRGSAAGSVVAYCLGITDVDPMRYDLLFERFLNPERVSPPDIDIDFDDEGRQQVIDFVIERYGKQSVAQIITYGTMGAKTAIRDVGRVMGIPLADVNRIAKLIPESPSMDFGKAFKREENPEGWEELTKLREDGFTPEGRMLRTALTLEGTARQIGIHAAGVIIAPGDITDYVPVAINNTRDNIVITQYDGPLSEKVGLLKMDFLGLKTLSILKTAARNVQNGHGITVDLDNLPLDDPKTFELYQNGETVATFQFESDGMRKYLRQLKPTTVEDLIAMNALYRPGPMDNIPEFIDRKQGRKPIVYDHPALEPVLQNTYGIMVYQEQIMRCAQVIAGYSLGEADILRRIMGKKKVEEVAAERNKFVPKAVALGVEEGVADKIFATMAKFAEYGFNKSHSAAYSVLAYRTAYLKANYPAEYMAAVLSHWLDNIDRITQFIEEARRMGIQVLQPCINESELLFSVTGPNQIRFGLGAIKGLGENAAKAIIEGRVEDGVLKPYASVFDLTSRVSSRNLNKKFLECLVFAGAFDTVAPHIHRNQYMALRQGEDQTVLDRALQYGQRVQAEKDAPQMNLFGGGGPDTASALTEPPIPPAEEWSLVQQLNFEKDVIGFYLSAHPLDRYKYELKSFTNASLDMLEDKQNQEVRFGAIVTERRERSTKQGAPFLQIVLEDYTGKREVMLFNRDYEQFATLLKPSASLLVTGRMEPSFRDKSVFELRLKKVQLLEGLLEEKVKQLQVDLPLSRVEPELLMRLEQVFKAHKGTCAVRFRMVDPAVERMVVLPSRSTLVTPSPELRAALQELNLTFTLN